MGKWSVGRARPANHPAPPPHFPQINFTTQTSDHYSQTASLEAPPGPDFWLEALLISSLTSFRRPSYVTHAHHEVLQKIREY